MEREYRVEVAKLREENEDKTLDIERLHGRINTLEAAFHTYRDSHVETLHAAHSIVTASLVVRSMILGVIAITAMIGGLSATYEIISRMFKE